MASCANCVEERVLFLSFVKSKGRSYRLCHRCSVYALYTGILPDFHHPTGTPADQPLAKPTLDEIDATSTPGDSREP